MLLGSNVAIEIQVKPCKNCGELFEKTPQYSQKRWGERMYCSIQCSKTLLSKGKLPDHVYAGLLKFHEDRFQNLARGERHYKWKGGVSWGFLRRMACERDDYTCQECGHREPAIMEVDHIKRKADYPELAKDLDNLMTLCPNCHRRKTNHEIGKSILKPSINQSFTSLGDKPAVGRHTQKGY